ncbi:hypothetical protein CHS0354_012537 [Potamilus streckersoni]|uniref:Protein Wnt n=1 Tax=Potamilus streckersoni TaxID=2493646 RepID=A0AAE0SVY7_9BIVA|nr:hypothetical protein CHS0354_012537 [Potamilus streckersoni]
MRIQGICVCLYFYLMFPANIIGLWWAVGSPLVMDPNRICRKSRRLAGKQREICRTEKEIVEEVANGVKLSLAECQYQFRQRRWNCTTVRKSFARILRKDTRETAFVFAITSAGVVYAVTKSCSAGKLLQCSCESSQRDMATDGEWEWGGCGDNVHYGYIKSKEFMDARRKKKRGDMTTLIQIHNNEAGRTAVKNYMRIECKCHGLSGSCTLKTCWKMMPYFRDVGNRLKEKFDGAAKVILSNDGKKLLPDGVTIKPPDKEDLLYSEKSPNFCKSSRKHGSLGTSGRECDPKSPGVEGCELLCCGRGYDSKQVTFKENCKCEFHWCCKVICQTCIVEKTLHYCL